MTEPKNVAKGFTSLFSENVMTVPNLMTCIRIILIIPFLTMFYSENYIMSLTVLAFSGVTDFLDGFIARTFNQTSQLGKYLDPLADKLTLFAVGFCVSVMFPRLYPIIILLAVKEILMIAGSLVLLKKSINPPSARWYGKAATFSFYVSALTAVVVYFFGIELYLTVNVLFAVTFVLMFTAMIGYYKIFKSLLNYS